MYIRSRVQCDYDSVNNVHTVQCSCAYGPVFMYIQSSVHVHTVQCTVYKQSSTYGPVYNVHTVQCSCAYGPMYNVHTVQCTVYIRSSEQCVYIQMSQADMMSVVSQHYNSTYRQVISKTLLRCCI